MFNGEAPEIPGGKEALLEALRGPRTGAVALSADLDPSDPFQGALYGALEQGFSPEPGPAPFVLGARKP